MLRRFRLTDPRAGIIAAIITAAGGVIAAVLITNGDDTRPVSPGICNVSGHPEKPGKKLFINAALSGRSGSTNRDRIVAVAVFFRNPGVWQFRRVDQRGDRWAIPASVAWEVGRPPYEGPREPFSFQALAMVRQVRIPSEGEERRVIPAGLVKVGDEITRTRNQLIQGRDYNDPDC